MSVSSSSEKLTLATVSMLRRRLRNAFLTANPLKVMELTDVTQTFDDVFARGMVRGNHRAEKTHQR